MPNSYYVKAIRSFKTEEERNIYADGLEKGLQYAPYGCSHPEPVTVRKEYDLISKTYSAYIYLGYYDTNGNCIFP